MSLADLEGAPGALKLVIASQQSPRAYASSESRSASLSNGIGLRMKQSCGAQRSRVPT